MYKCLSLLEVVQAVAEAGPEAVAVVVLFTEIQP
jgi:hypothetical protein